MAQRCAVHCCDYVVEGYIEDFPVCSLHEARQTRGILEQGELPCSGKSCDRPIVYRAGIALAVEHFEPKESHSGLKAFEDPYILETPSEPKGHVHPDQDLTVE